MKKAALAIMLVLAIFMTGCSQVKYGYQVKCKHCKKILSDQSKKKIVMNWEKKKYKLDVMEDCCNDCKVEVKYGSKTICRNCKKSDYRQYPQGESRSGRKKQLSRRVHKLHALRWVLE